MKRRQKEPHKNPNQPGNPEKDIPISHQKEMGRIKNILINEEPTHMSWDEVRKEAQKLGIPLKNQPNKDFSLDNSINTPDNDTINTAQIPSKSECAKSMLKENLGHKRDGKTKQKQGKRDEKMSKSVASLKPRHLIGGSIFYSDSDDYYQNAPRVNPAENDEVLSRRVVREGNINVESERKWKEVESGSDKRPPAFLKNILKLRNFFKRLDSRYDKSCDCEEMRRKEDRCVNGRFKEKIEPRECENCRRLCQYCSEDSEDLVDRKGMSRDGSRGRFRDMSGAISGAMSRDSSGGMSRGMSGVVGESMSGNKKSQLGSVFSVRSVQSECNFCRPNHHQPHELSSHHLPTQPHKRLPPLFVKLPQQRLQRQVEEHDKPQQQKQHQQQHISQQQQFSQQQFHPQQHSDHHQKSSSLNRNLQRSNRFDSCLSFSSSSEQNTLEKQPSKMMSSSGYTALEVIDFQIFASALFPQLKYILWYWGSLERDGAVRLLSDKREGTYLIRDSSDDRYVLAISFKSQADIHHTGIEYFDGKFSFHEPSPPILQPKETPDNNNTSISTDQKTNETIKSTNDNNTKNDNNQTPFNDKTNKDNNTDNENNTKDISTKENIVDFIERASRNAMIEADKYFLQPRKDDSSAVPLKLWWPLLRPMESLRNLTTDVVIHAIGGADFIKILPVGLDLKKIVKNRFKAKKC